MRRRAAAEAGPGSPSTRRAWIEIRITRSSSPESGVALHPEGVDRNSILSKAYLRATVALHPEGVDRNECRRRLGEIRGQVALHPEGVDRNSALR